METRNWKELLQSYDERRDLIIPGDLDTTIQFCVDQFLSLAKEAIANHKYFSVALSGGSTPKAIYQGILKSPLSAQVDWNHVLLFWSDERCVPKNHPDSNYRMAMEAGFNKLPIPPENIFPMPCEGDLKDLENQALAYEKLIKKNIPSGTFDLVMLGMGEDGHTASLFPKTHGLHTTDRLVITNFIPEKNVWRMSLTYECINAAKKIVIYVLGGNKAEMIENVLTAPYTPDLLPIQKIGTAKHKAIWVMDNGAADKLNKEFLLPNELNPLELD